MCNVCVKKCTNFVCYLSKFWKVNVSWVSWSANNYKVWLSFFSSFKNFFIIKDSLISNSIKAWIINFTWKINIWSMIRWPPCAKSRPRILSPGFKKASNTAVLAWDPEWGWTFAYSTLKSVFRRSMAIFSILSTTSHPP